MSSESKLGVIQRYYALGITPILDDYRQAIAQSESILEIEGKTLRKANTEQTTHQSYYDQLRSDCKALHKVFKLEKVDKRKGEIWKEYTENSDIELSSKDKEIYVMTDKKYADVLTILWTIEEVLDQLTAICEGFRARGYALKNITELVVSSVDDRII